MVSWLCIAATGSETVLERITGAIAELINRSVTQSTQAQEICARNAGRTLVVAIRDTSFACTLGFSDEGVSLSPEHPDDADAAIEGTPSGFLSLVRSGSLDAFQSGRVSVTGDTELAADVQKLFRYAKPDFEEEMSRVVGDAAAFQFGSFVRSARAWGRQTAETLHANLGEYLQEESRAVPTAFEAEEFMTAVDVLRDAADRFTARLERIRKAGQS